MNRQRSVRDHTEYNTTWEYAEPTYYARCSHRLDVIGLTSASSELAQTLGSLLLWWRVEKMAITPSDLELENFQIIPINVLNLWLQECWCISHPNACYDGVRNYNRYHSCIYFYIKCYSVPTGIQLLWLIHFITRLAWTGVGKFTLLVRSTPYRVLST